MRIDIKELEVGPLALDLEVGEAELEFDSSEVLVLEKFRVNLAAERQLQEIRIRGQFQVNVEVPCSRCLEPVRFPVVAQFDQFYESNAEHPLEGEIELHEKDTGIGFYSGDFIEVGDIVREQILLALPMKPICEEACKGLCPHCGKNRNQETCGCESMLVDPRLVQLLQIKNKMSF